MKIKTYDINGTTYEQRPLGIIPGAQLGKLLREQSIAFSAGMGPAEVIDLIAPVLPQAMAILLTEQGTRPWEKDVEALAEEFGYNLPADIAIEVIADFFELTPVHLIADRMTGMLSKMMTEPTPTKSQKPKSSSASSQRATSAGATK